MEKKFNKKEYDLNYQKGLAAITIRMSKEEKERIDCAAQRAGMSTRKFIMTACEEKIKRTL